jgi:signal transduction histidine kinase/DNA-binding response OmpR family regulator/ligand-binding sensor domain-containing protein
LKPFLQVFVFLARFLALLLFSHTYAQQVHFPKPQVISAGQGLPQGFVPGIVQDSQGLIWIATRNGLCRYDGRHIKILRPGNEKSPSLSSLGMESLSLDAGKKIWILTDQGDVDVFDPVSETFVNYSRQPFFQQAFSGKLLKMIFPDKQNRLWLGFEKAGMAVVDLQSQKIQWYIDKESDHDTLKMSKVRQIEYCRDGSIWIVSRNGMFNVDKNSGDLRRYHSNDPDFKWIEKTSYALEERQNGDLLLVARDGVATLKARSGDVRYYPLPSDQKSEYDHPVVSDSKGNNYFFRMNSLFRFSDQEGLQKYAQEDGFSEFKSLFVDHSDVLWAGTNGQGVRKFNLRAAYFTALPYASSFIQDILKNGFNVTDNQLAKLPANLFVYNFRYTYDHQENLWFAAGQTPLYRLGLKTGKLETIQFPTRISRSEHSNLAISLATDPAGRIWALHDSILVYFENGRWENFRFPVRPAVESGVMQMVVDQEALWIATSGKGLYRLDRNTGKVRRYGHVEGNAATINNDNIYCLFADPKDANLLWLGTFGGGLSRFDKRTGQVRNITTKDGLPNDVVYTAIPDRFGNVWAGTNQGLARVDKRTFQVRVYTREDGLQADEFNRFHSIILPHGRIFLGGIEGITSFDPAKPYEDKFQPKTLITSISINNELIEKGPITGRVPVTATRNLELDYRKNFIDVEFAAMQFNRSDKIRYRYQLSGLEEHWIETENPVTKYTALRPGRYVLRLNASNTEGRWSNHITTLEITIHPPWWQTWWAYLLYAVAAFALGYWLLKMYTNRLKLRQSMLLQQKELELIDKESRQLRELDEMKTRFFSNITHEFRTPLTLILTPAGQMLEEPRNPEDINRLGLIDRHAHQLLGLVNQLLDLSKLEAGSMKVNEVQSDLDEFVKRLVASFQGTAEAKKISLHYLAENVAGAYWFDHEKLERILNNLLSNAMKFTPETGEVTLSLTGKTDGVVIVVSDTGIGIPAEKLGQIFERFYQVDSGTGYREGTGIGLAIVKELVEMQKGTIRVESDGRDRGTTFTIELPYRKAASSQEKQVFDSDNQHIGEQYLNNPPFAASILLVEDHLELGDFVAGSLGKHYQCYRAGNGEEALALMKDFMPDLVISDIMMPVMDGYTLCRKIKSDLQTSHIPVILLTAKSAVESKLEGLSEGADDYLTKPFHIGELEIRIRNMLTRQRRIREMLHAQFTSNEKLISNPETDPFLVKLYEILEAQLDNTSFGVNELTIEIGMSNSSLNRKVKALTNLSPVELIRNFRLKKAAEYLSSGTGVSEAAYLVGFDNLSYFAKCFRDLFQMSPREFAARTSEAH